MIETLLKLVVLLLAGNGAPVLATRFFRSRGALPVDLGRCLRDGQPLFGASKTWRGLVAAVLTSCAVSAFLGYGARFGLLFGLLIMAGDLLSSFIKRRSGLQPGDRCPGLDQLPEAFIPSLYAVGVLGIAWWWAVVLAAAFMLLEIVISKPLYWLRIRKQPH